MMRINTAIIMYDSGRAKLNVHPLLIHRFCFGTITLESLLSK